MLSLSLLAARVGMMVSGMETQQTLQIYPA